MSAACRISTAISLLADCHKGIERKQSAGNKLRPQDSWILQFLDAFHNVSQNPIECLMNSGNGLTLRSILLSHFLSSLVSFTSS